ncbi:hypothetical protein FRC01_002726 [Tulasnella sp. 417]|nr:hypothetical protein FRC01_002726 [Tulasnella sp. 417]
MLLDLVPDAPKPEYASTLRSLHSYIPLCWDYEPRKRPSISLVRRHTFMFSFESDAGDSVVATLEELAHLLIPPERLRLIENSELGSGTYGEVIVGTLDESSPSAKDVAVKRLKAVGTRGERRLARELNIWAKIKHPNVVELIGYYLDEKYETPLLISTLMPNRDVLQYIANFKPDIQQRIAFMKGITAGLACLHNLDPAICHADLKPANVLVDLHMNAVLCDFGLASFVGGSPSAPGLATTTTLKGTPRYMSPELHFDDDCTHSLESDVWAWACTVFHVLTGSIPYVKALGERQLCMAILQEQPPGDIELLLPEHFADADSESALALRFLHAVVPRCWDFEPRCRPLMSTLLSQISNLTSEIVDSLSRMEDGGLDALDAEGTPAEASEIPTGERTYQDEVAREADQCLLESARIRGEEAIAENVRVEHEETQTQGGTDHDEPSTNVDAQEDARNTLISACSQEERMVEENIRVGQDEAAMKDGGDKNEQKQLDQSAAAQPDSLAAIRPDHSPDTISTRPLSTFIWPAVFTLSEPDLCISDVAVAEAHLYLPQSDVDCHLGCAPYEESLSADAYSYHASAPLGSLIAAALRVYVGESPPTSGRLGLPAHITPVSSQDTSPGSHTMTSFIPGSSMGLGYAWQRPGSVESLHGVRTRMRSSPPFPLPPTTPHHPSMAAARVSFATPPSSEPDDSSSTNSVEALDARAPSLVAARGVFESLAHLVIAPERLTFIDNDSIAGGRFRIYFAKLDETSQTPKDVAVERLLAYREDDPGLRTVIRLARQLKVRAGLRHPNVLELLGYYLSPNYETAQLISPYLINGNLRDYLWNKPVGITERLGFVRDITAGLDYLHSQSSPIIHGDLRPVILTVINIMIDENLNAVLSSFELALGHSGSNDPSGLTTSNGMKGVFRYMSPELIVDDGAKKTLASDIWAWGCTAFEILTRDEPFHQYKSNSAILAALLRRNAPGRAESLLDLVPDASKPEYASTLRLLHSYIPLCWEYEPRKRPSTSLLRRQALMFSFESDPGDSVVATLEELAHLLIPSERLRLVERSELGSGNYGEVVLGTLDELSPTPKDVAVKRLKAVGTRGERVRLAKRLARELNIWAKIKHPNVVELIGYYLDEKYESPLLISELMVNGNVLDYINRFKPDTEQRISFVKDLKPANVLIDLHMNAVLCDFGLAAFVSGSGTSPGLVTSTTVKGTPRYMSPELLMEDDCTHSLSSDIWAWGCTVFQVLTGHVPYAEAVGEGPFYLAIAQKKFPGDVTLLLPNDSESVDPNFALTLRFLRSTLPRCWDFDSRKRPSIRTLLLEISSPSLPTGVRADEEDAAQTDSLPQDGATALATSEDSLGERTCNEDGTQGDVQNILESAYPGGEEVTKDDSEFDQREAVTLEAAKPDESRHEDHNTMKAQAIETTPDRPVPITSSLPLSTVALGVTCIFALGAILYQLLKIFRFLSQSVQGPTSNTNPFFPRDSSPPLSTLILATACIVSFCANIYQFFQKKGPFPPGDQAAMRQASEQDG